jgi:hypothetical protein
MRRWFLPEIFVWTWLVMLAAALALSCGCSPRKSCEEHNTELTLIWNDYLDEVSALSEDEIIEKCNQTQEACPNCSLAWELEGLVHWENDRMDEALVDYLVAAKLAPYNESLLNDARTVAFNAKGMFLFVAEDGTLGIKPFGLITLAEYAEYPEDTRLQWCEAKSGELRAAYTKGLNRAVSYELTSAQDLDARLLSEARQKPGTMLSMAMLGYSLRGCTLQ